MKKIKKLAFKPLTIRALTEANLDRIAGGNTTVAPWDYSAKCSASCRAACPLSQPTVCEVGACSVAICP